MADIRITHWLKVNLRTQGKRQWPHRSLGKTYRVVLEGLLLVLAEAGAALAHCGHEDTGNSGSGEYSRAWALSEAAIFSPRPGPTQQPIGSSAGTLQTRQPTWQEHSPSPQYTDCLKSSWAYSCPLSTQHPHQRDKTQLHPPEGKHQPPWPGSLHKPLRPHPPEGRQQKQEKLQPWSLWNRSERERGRENIWWDSWRFP